MSQESSAGEKALYLFLGAMIVAGRAKAAAEKTAEFVERGKEILQKQKDSVAAAVDAGKQAYREEKDKA